MRDLHRSNEPEILIKLPQSRTRISFRLLEGNGKGAYLVCITNAFNKPLVSTKAISADGKILRVVLDATSLEAKTYRLYISREGEAPDYYYAVIEKMKTM
jgi:hypothetical protein